MEIRRNFLKGVLVLVSVVLLGAKFVLAKSPAEKVTPTQPQLSLAHLTVRVTATTYGNRPVFEITNATRAPIRHFIVDSWSGDALPLLYIGQRLPLKQAITPLADPPYVLPSGQSAWFISPNRPPTSFTVYWNDGSSERYENISVES